MMKAPVLTKQQQKKTLSGRKGRRECIKNVLGTPLEIYWPQAEPRDDEVLMSSLIRNLPRIQHPKISIPYDEIREIPKNERKNYRKKVTSQISEYNTSDTKDRESLVFGVNAVSKLLEKNQAGSIIIDKSVRPRFMVMHIIDKAVLYGCSLMIIDKLSQLLKDHCGISSVCFALKKNLDVASKLFLLHQTICRLSATYKIPSAHINYLRAIGRSDHDSTTVNVKNINLKENFQDNSGASDCEIIDVFFDGESKYDLKKPSSDCEIIDVCFDGEPKYHLKRSTKNQRVFHPEPSEATQDNNMIALNPMYNGPYANHQLETGFYRGLTVKRVKGDMNRTLRKIQLVQMEKSV